MKRRLYALPLLALLLVLTLLTCERYLREGFITEVQALRQCPEDTCHLPQQEKDMKTFLHWMRILNKQPLIGLLIGDEWEKIEVLPKQHKPAVPSFQETEH